MSLSEQNDQHDPVKAVRRIKEFKWTMIKLDGYLQNALDDAGQEDGGKSRLSYYNKFRSEVTHNIDDSSYAYQGINLKNFEASKAL